MGHTSEHAANLINHGNSILTIPNYLWITILFSYNAMKIVVCLKNLYHSISENVFYGKRSPDKRYIHAESQNITSHKQLKVLEAFLLAHTNVVI